MKKHLLLLLTLLLGASAFAQTQQGFMKTKGRLANDGTVIPGERIPNAAIILKGGNSTVSGPNGDFSLLLPNSNFYLQNVQKEGYVLTDPEVLSKRYSYSPNDMIIVMEDLAQLEADRRAIERKISGKLYAQLLQRSEELESQKAQNKITEEKYLELQKQLNRYQDDNEKIIKDMAERYTKMDFDQINEFNRKISEYILNGELLKADSMLDSKGNVHQRIDRLNMQHEANAQVKADLEKSESIEQNDREDIANHCYQKSEIFKLKHLNDSAAYYLELRVSLDTTNSQWMSQAGEFIQNYNADYNKALGYFESILRQKLSRFGEQDPSVATCYYNIGSINAIKGKYQEAKEHFLKALEIWTYTIGEEHPDVANCYNNLGYIYMHQSDFTKAMEYYEKALSIQTNLHGENHPDVSNTYNNIGAVYANQGDFAKGLEYYEKAFNINKDLYGEEHPKTAYCYNNIGSIYSYQGEHEKAMEYYNKALNIQLLYFGKNHPYVARSYNNLGYAQSKLGNYDKAMEYYDKALTIWESTLGENHNNVAACYNNMGAIYSKRGDYENAARYYKKALSIIVNVLGETNRTTAMLNDNIGRLYSKQHDYDQALEYFNKAYSIYNSLYGSEDSRTIEAKELIEQTQAKIAEQENKE